MAAEGLERAEEQCRGEGSLSGNTEEAKNCIYTDLAEAQNTSGLVIRGDAGGKISAGSWALA